MCHMCKGYHKVLLPYFKIHHLSLYDFPQAIRRHYNACDCHVICTAFNCHVIVTHCAIITPI